MKLVFNDLATTTRTNQDNIETQNSKDIDQSSEFNDQQQLIKDKPYSP